MIVFYFTEANDIFIFFSRIIASFVFPKLLTYLMAALPMIFSSSILLLLDRLRTHLDMHRDVLAARLIEPLEQPAANVPARTAPRKERNLQIVQPVSASQ